MSFAVNHLKRFSYLNLNSIENKNPRKITKYGDVIDSYGDVEFKLRYRMTKESAIEFIKIIAPKLTFSSKRNNPVPVQIQFLITIRYYATGAFQQLVGDTFFDISQQTVSNEGPRLIT